MNKSAMLNLRIMRKTLQDLSEQAAAGDDMRLAWWLSMAMCFVASAYTYLAGKYNVTLGERPERESASARIGTDD